MSAPEEKGWRLDRRVPLIVIVTALLQLGGALVWATNIDARVSVIEQQTALGSDVSERLARLDERLEGVRQNVEGVKRQLEHLSDKLLK